MAETVTIAAMRPIVHSVLLLCLALSGCKKEEEPPAQATSDAPAEAPPTRDTPSPTGEACGGPSRPCTWAEVPDETIVRIQAVADLAIETLHAGNDPAKVAEVLRAQPDVSVLSATDEMVRYHVEGGRPAWVWLRSSKRGPTIGTPPPIPITLAMAPPAASKTTPPVGAQDAGTKPKKKVLILSPFRWHWQIWTQWAKKYGPDADTRAAVFDDETDALEEKFEAVPDYAGGVTRKENALSGTTIQFGVRVEDFASWRKYDVIHVSTHGTSCAAGATDCEPALASGDLLAIPGADADRQKTIEAFNVGGVDVGFIPYGADPNELAMGQALTPKLRFKGPKSTGADGKVMDGATVHTAGPFMLLTKTWFHKRYGKDLADKIIFLSACNSSSQEASLPQEIAGPGTAVIGWSKTMSLHEATYGADLFWSLVLGHKQPDILTPVAGGLTVEAAFAKMAGGISQATLTKGPLKSIVIEGAPVDDDATGATLGREGDGKTRAREIVSLVRGRKHVPLQDGDFVEIEGAPGDGKPDALKLTAEVIGIVDGEDPATYLIGVDVEGKTATDTWKPTEQVEPGRWRGEATVALGFDLEAGKTFALEPWVDLPGGGRSRWRYEDIGVQYLTLTITGPAFGSPQTFTFPAGSVGFRTGTPDMVTTMFRADGKRVVVSADDSSIEHLLGGLEVGSLRGTGEIPITDEGHWMAVIYLQGTDCSPSSSGCKSVQIDTTTGTMNVTTFSRDEDAPQRFEGPPTVITGTFEVAATGHRGEIEGEAYQIEGAFSLQQ